LDVPVQPDVADLDVDDGFVQQNNVVVICDDMVESVSTRGRDTAAVAAAVDNVDVDAVERDLVDSVLC
jgi:hypothetical protein